MVESGSKEVSEELVADAIEFAHMEIKKIVAAINELVSRAGKPKRAVTPPEFDHEYFEALKAKIGDRLKDALDTKAHPQVRERRLWSSRSRTSLRRRFPPSECRGCEEEAGAILRSAARARSSACR